MVADARPRYTVTSDRSPKVVSIERHLIVGRLMEYGTQADDALTAVSAAIQYAAAATIEPGALEAIRVLRSARTTLTELRADLRRHSGEFDGVDGAA